MFSPDFKKNCEPEVNTMGTESEQDPHQRAERNKARLIKEITQQAADLVNKGKVPPEVVADTYILAASALALQMGIPTGEVAALLRLNADRVEEGGDTALASRN
jgi:hypothetical protein